MVSCERFATGDLLLDDVLVGKVRVDPVARLRFEALDEFF